MSKSANPHRLIYRRLKMNTGELLESLLGIANMKQRVFAENMYASPSKISKIINGKLTVSAAEARSFSQQAARIFEIGRAHV